MNHTRLILTGIIVWALIFVEWSIIIFAPILKDLGNWQWLIHYIVLIPIVWLGASIYYQKKSKVSGLKVGIGMLIVGIILDSLVTVPFFVAPQGETFSSFFLNPFMLVGFAILLVTAWYYKNKLDSK
jgi:RsiW-degrading membrane proteinase PrsW (M82 family)